MAVLLFVTLCAVFPLLYTVPATLFFCISVPLLYSWLWEQKRQADEPMAVKRDFPQLVEVREQLLEEKRAEQYERDERRQLSKALPSPRLAVDYASQTEVSAEDVEEEDVRQRMPERAKLVV